jgi:phage major head subunit gpT-like protein
VRSGRSSSSGNAGYGLWQLAHASQQTLDVDNYFAARAAMQGLKGDGGRPLAISPNLLVVPPSLEKRALEVVTVERLANGADNPAKGTAQVLVCPWLG